MMGGGRGTGDGVEEGQSARATPVKWPSYALQEPSP